jgi:hypothetical protein
MNLGESSKLASIAVQYGPFFFSILFCIVLSKWGYSIYKNANVRVKPKPASKQEINTYRYYFILITIFGVILVIISVFWWIRQQSSIHLFKGDIINVGENHRFVSSDMYLKRVKVGELGSEDSPMDVYKWQFFCFQMKPFKDDQKFILLHKKTGGNMERAEIQFSQQPDLQYEIVFDENTGKNILKLKTEIAGMRASYSGLLYADVFPQERQIPFNKDLILQKRMNEEALAEMIEVLQEETSDLGKKIEIVDYLSFMAENTELRGRFENILSMITPKEPVLLTLLDLTRHTDRELAFKCRRLVFDKYHFDNILKERIGSNNEALHEGLELILFRIEREMLLEIMGSIPEENRSRFYFRIMELIESGKKSRVLKPTGSARGDRYYMQIEWDRDNPDSVQRLAEIFTELFFQQRTLEEERNLMEEQGHRILWRHSKRELLSIIDPIEHSGGNITFISYGPQSEMRQIRSIEPGFF